MGYTELLLFLTVLVIQETRPDTYKECLVSFQCIHANDNGLSWCTLVNEL